MNSTLIILSTKAIQRISESVFVGLCRKVGTSQVVAIRRDVMDFRDMVRNQVKSSHKFRLMVSGSQREGFRLKGSDIDSMFWPSNNRVIWELSQSQYYNTHRQALILCDCSDSPPGFTLLYLLSPKTNRYIFRACVRMNNRYYVSSSKHRQIFLSNSTFNYNPTPHGPCASRTLGTQESDHAYCLISDIWPPSASPWIDRCHSWPQPHVVDDKVKNGCHFVAIGHKLGNHEDHEWRISFSQAEQKLVFVMNHCQFLTYGLLKLILTEIINNGVGDDDKLMCSYHMKTAVFWVIQQNTVPHWSPQNLLEGFWVCFKLILKWVYEGVCPNFFIPDNNMFLSKIHGVKQNQLFIRLSELYEKGLAFLLHSPSIRSCIIDVLYNPRNSICTEDHILISEAEFDGNLFCEILRHYTIPVQVDMQICIRYLQTIEQMISLPLLTQCQVIMLQNMTATILQYNAFIFHIETYTPDKKLSYRADKMSCHMLKLAARFGCITDMLYIAMHYYKTLRYMEALSIIDMIKVKLAQPYVMNMGNRDKEIHVDTMRAQTARDDLQTLVHYDQGQLIFSDHRDISWQILGICQQVTGNPHAALYSYQQSLRQEPFHNIQTATEMRIQSLSMDSFN
ncbi:uncharacterized protein LOC134253977 [Saccostrea cucullata]|uniref:uncharacterized protein LOC134253977 n=1 Tax=Saccostrea cuccullata TaxID=36930 RepID=UPI002ED21C52